MALGIALEGFLPHSASKGALLRTEMASPSQSCLRDVLCSASGPGTLRQMPEPDFPYIQAHVCPEVSQDTNAFRIGSFSCDGVWVSYQHSITSMPVEMISAFKMLLLQSSA